MRGEVFFYSVLKLLYNFMSANLGSLYDYTQSKIDMVKLLRVYGGCLGVDRR